MSSNTNINNIKSNRYRTFENWWNMLPLNLKELMRLNNNYNISFDQINYMLSNLDSSIKESCNLFPSEYNYWIKSGQLHLEPENPGEGPYPSIPGNPGEKPFSQQKLDPIPKPKPQPDPCTPENPGEEP